MSGEQLFIGYETGSMPEKCCCRPQKHGCDRETSEADTDCDSGSEDSDKSGSELLDQTYLSVRGLSLRRAPEDFGSGRPSGLGDSYPDWKVLSNSNLISTRLHST